MKKGLMAVALTLGASLAFAAPDSLITHNQTSVASNAYIGGKVPSPHPTQAHSNGSVSWFLVKMACFPFTKNGICPAMIKMDTNSDSPVELGMVFLNVNTGEITPKTLSANGYTMTVNGLAEATLTED